MAGRVSRTVGDSAEATREYHVRYLRAVGDPTRRGILRELRAGDASFEELRSRTGLDARVLRWHLDILENGFCVERAASGGASLYRLTREGSVVDRIEG